MKPAGLIVLALLLAGRAFTRESADRMTDGDGAAIAEYIKRSNASGE